MCWLFLCITNRRRSWNISKAEQSPESKKVAFCFNTEVEEEVKLKGFRKIDHNLSLYHNNKAAPVECQQAARLAHHNILVY